jgi:hypothetical protein
MNPLVYEYKGGLFPEYLKRGNACQHIAATAAHFCRGNGLDVGAGRWPLPGAIPIELADGGDAMELPHGPFDFVFSSHWLPQNCRKHLHSWQPEEIARVMRDLGLVDVIHSERDLAWSFAAVGFKPEEGL